jgi:superfamily II DNA or RNA helicase
MPAKYRLGLSDDHHRIDGKTFIVTSLVGPQMYKIGDKDLIKKGAIVDVNVLADATNFKADWYEEIKRDGGRPTGEEFNRLLDEMTTDGERNDQIVKRIAERVKAGLSFLVFSHREAHCRALARGLEYMGVPSGIMLGGTPEFKETRAGLLNGTIKAGVGTLKALGKGINVPRVDGGYATTPIATSSQTWRQAKGRVVRPKDHEAEFWFAWDRYVEGDRPVRKVAKRHRDRLRIAVGSERFTVSEYAASVR